MAVAGDVEGDGVSGSLHREDGAAQAEQATQLLAGDGHAAHCGGGHPSGVGQQDILHPAAAVAGQPGVGVGFAEDGAELLGGEGVDAVVVGHAVRFLRAFHTDKVRQLRRPYVAAGGGGTGGGGVEHRHDRRAVVQHHLPVGFRHRLLYLGLVLVEFVAPFGSGVLLAEPRGAAVGVGAYVGVGVGGLLAAGHAVVEIGALRHRLGLQGFEFKGGGHLTPHHAGQILRRRQGLHGAAVPQTQGVGGVGAGAVLRCGLLGLDGLGRGVLLWGGLLRPQPRRQKQQHQQKESRRDGLSHGYTSFPPDSVGKGRCETGGKHSCNKGCGNI